MILIKEIEIKGFRNLKHVTLRDLKDLNILIGPNNCGKTNVLELIAYFSKLDWKSVYEYPFCQQCDKFRDNMKIVGVFLSIPRKDFYLRKNPREQKVRINILLNKEQIEDLVPKVLDKQEIILSQINCPKARNGIVLESDESCSLYAEHFSIFIHGDILEELTKSILYCPEGRLQNYRNKSFAEYIREKKFSGAMKRRLIKFIADVVDPKVHDYKYEDLIRRIEDEDLVVTIEEQGSGVRSLICLVADLLSAKDARIILIDEPELGLNPLARQEFLKILLELTKDKQIFIATQDSTFVNPILWKNNKVAVHFYSLISENFVKVDLNQNREDPAVFAGYLPHTTSLKDIHIYVEGTSDVYIFQILLEKFLRTTFSENWFELVNKVGIFHLCGDFWIHLLYTIPKPPYKCIVILDGDKRKMAEKIIKKHNSFITNASRFKLCDTIEMVGDVFRGAKYHPVYCLKESCIEKYLFPNFDPSNPPKGYDKRKDGAKAAERLEKLPEELIKLFKTILDVKDYKI